MPLLIVAVLALSVTVMAQEKLTIISWGGAYGAAQKKHMIEPFEKEYGVKVLFDDYSGGIAEISSQVKSGKVTWDVVDFEYVDLEKACSENLLVRLDTSFLPKGDNGASARKDFYPEALSSECAIGNIYWSTAFAYNKKTIGRKKPKTIKDFFNIKRIPGKRAMRKRAEVNLEWALIADGVKKKDVYKVLATKKGQDRAFRKLSTIKDDIIWIESWSQAPQLLNDGTATIVQSANGRVTDFEVVWDAHAFDLDGWAIVKGSKNVELAKKFIAFSTSTKPLVGMKDVNYGPTRKSSSKLLTRTERNKLPSSYLKKGFKVDGGFWADFTAELNERFNAWLLK